MQLNLQNAVDVFFSELSILLCRIVNMRPMGTLLTWVTFETLNETCSIVFVIFSIHAIYVYELVLDNRSNFIINNRSKSEDLRRSMIEIIGNVIQSDIFSSFLCLPWRFWWLFTTFIWGSKFQEVGIQLIETTMHAIYGYMKDFYTNRLLH